MSANLIFNIIETSGSVIASVGVIIAIYTTLHVKKAVSKVPEALTEAFKNGKIEAPSNGEENSHAP